MVFRSDSVRSAWTLTIRLLLLSSVSLLASARSYAQQSVESTVFRNYALTVAAQFSNGQARLLIAGSNDAQPLLTATDLQSSRAIGQRAVSALRDLAPGFGFAGATVSEAATTRVANVWQTTATLTFDGIPVRGGVLHMVTGALTGKIISVTSEIPAMKLLTVTPGITTDAITARFGSYLTEDQNPFTVKSEPRLILIPRQKTGTLVLAYETLLEQREPDHLWRLTIDASSGELLEKKEMLEFFGSEGSSISGRVEATVHLHSPTDTLTTVGLPFTTFTINGTAVTTDSAGYWSYTGIGPLLVSAGLRGPYSSIARQDGVNASIANLTLGSPYRVSWNDVNSDVSERDAYYSVAYARAYVRAMDPGLVRLDDAIGIKVNLNQTCNAYYDPSNITLNFFKAGNSCSNTAQISDVVYHEFGHRVMHARYAAAGKDNLTNGSLNEGFADVTSAFMRDDPRIGIGFYSSNKSQILRNCENTKSWPKDLNADIHLTGMIISGSVWDLRKLIGLKPAEHLFNMATSLAPDAADEVTSDVMQTAFVNTLLAFLTVDDDDNELSNGTPHSTEILQAFAKHNITLSGLISLATEAIGDQDSSADSYDVHVKAAYRAHIGAIDPSSVTVHYSTDNGKTYRDQVAIRESDSLFVAHLPRVAPGTIVKYYSSAGLNLANAGSQTHPAQVSPFSFMVGFQRSFFDNAETDQGWTLSASTDRAATGRWVRGRPHGTYSFPNEYIQQDTDHTPNGTMCYITGNLNTTSVGADDVDSGSTTLMSPRLDLSEISSPLIRYWYFYTNDQGSNPGRPQWQTQVSSDDGQTWKNVQLTNASSDGWVSTLFRVSDYVLPTASVRVRFIASDNVGALVEAGVDDFEVLSGPVAPLTAAPIESTTAFAINSLYPNPGLSTGTVTASLTLNSDAHTVIVVKNILGEIVGHACDQMMREGTYQIDISSATKSLSPGTYWVVATTETGRLIRKLVIN